MTFYSFIDPNTGLKWAWWVQWTSTKTVKLPEMLVIKIKKVKSSFPALKSINGVNGLEYSQEPFYILNTCKAQKHLCMSLSIRTLTYVFYLSGGDSTVHFFFFSPSNSTVPNEWQVTPTYTAADLACHNFISCTQPLDPGNKRGSFQHFLMAHTGGFRNNKNTE